MNFSTRLVVIIIMATSVSQKLYADQEADKAIREVQQQMNEKGFADKASEHNPQAQKVRDHVKSISGNEANEKEMYELASKILGNFQGKSPEEIKKALEEAQGNPEAFMNSWTPEQKQQLKDLSERLPAANKAKP